MARVTIGFMDAPAQTVGYPHLCFIIMTGHADEYTYSNITEAGAADFIFKPFPIAELKAKLERIEKERSILAELQEKNEALLLEGEINASFARALESTALSSFL